MEIENIRDLWAGVTCIGGGRYYCEHCEYTGAVKHYMESHVRSRAHANKMLGNPNRKEFKCPKCDYETKNHSNGVRHMRRHLKEKQREIDREMLENERVLKREQRIRMDLMKRDLIDQEREDRIAALEGNKELLMRKYQSILEEFN